VPDNLLWHLREYLHEALGETDAAPGHTATGGEKESPSAQGIADVLWLARYLRPAEPAVPAETEVSSDLGQSDSLPPETRDAAADPVLKDPPVEPTVTPSPGGQEIEFHPSRPVSGPHRPDSRPAMTVHVPAIASLPDPLDLARAMRPLKRRVPTPRAVSIDEDATAMNFGKTELVLPAWRPETERWLQVDLVIDTSVSMALWRRTGVEMRALLEHQGAFRNVRTWAIDGDEPDKPRLLPFRSQCQDQAMPHSPAEIRDPSGRRAVVVMTDAVGAGWHSGAMLKLVATWGRTCPCAIVQVLPRSLWHRTALRTSQVTGRMKLGASPPLRVARAADADATCWVPVLRPHRKWVQPWATMVAGEGDKTAELFAIALDDDPESSGYSLDDNATVPAEDRLTRFFGRVSPEAAELAGYFAAAPLTLPIMRLVQRAILPESGPDQLAEVFLSGLLIRADPTAKNDDPDYVLYDFRDGIRELLLGSITRSESLQVLEVLQKVSGVVADRFGGTLDFRALAPTSGTIGEHCLPPGSEPFAMVAAMVLRGLGGLYADIAEAIAPSVSATIDAVSTAPVTAPAEPDVETPVTLVPEPTPSIQRVRRVDSGRRPGRRLRPAQSVSRLSFTQPMLFVGLGGTGCQIGVELERRLRDELCGPDGSDLMTRLPATGLLPFQLPSFLQFVYADQNEAELQRTKRFVVPAEEHQAAAAFTDHFVQKLVPRYRTYPEVARSLRAYAPEETRDWLPPAEGEPRVSPLVLGSGQLPTVGRAALFDALRANPTTLLEPVDNAIGRIANAGKDLHAFGGSQTNSCDIFVAFSVAGGTGAGIFYDMMKLIGARFDRAGFNVRIYPLVLMPSAFFEGQGGGRRARLNAGRALLDLFRLIDDQNSDETDALMGRPESTTRSWIRYPVLGEIALSPGIIPTAFLFSLPRSVERDDLHRSVVSFVMSQVSTGLASDSDEVLDRLYQSFSEQFINQGVERQVTAYTGIGNRSASDIVISNLSVPVDDLADIISSRLLARAVGKWQSLAHRDTDLYDRYIDRFYTASGLDELRDRRPEPFREPVPENGTNAVQAALAARASSMQDGLDALEHELRTKVPLLARDFDCRRGVLDGLTELDVFRLQSVLLGHPTRPGQGFAGSVERAGLLPPVPEGLTMTPPALGALNNRFRALRQLRWSDQDVIGLRHRQDEWLYWRSARLWSAAWAEQEAVWEPKIASLRGEVSGLADAFVEFARQEPESYALRTADLYKARTGVSYLLPPQGDLDQFYQAVVGRFVSSAELALRPMATEADIVAGLLGGEGWRKSYELVIKRGAEHGFEQAVLSVRALIKQQVKRLFVAAGSGDQPLLPALGDLLARAARRDGPSVGEDDLAAFRRSLAGLVPGGFSPEGSGDLRILVTYPQGAGDEQIEEFIRDHVNLPTEPTARTEFRATETQSIVVLLLRTSMSVTEVPELCLILRQWYSAIQAEEPQDFLRWRQRLSYDFSWLASTAEDRVKIMHRILCAMWNDRIITHGDPHSPDYIEITLTGDNHSRNGMKLKLTPFGQASSWTSLLNAYEEWTIADAQKIRQDFCRLLMNLAPDGIQRRPRRPSKLFQIFIDEIRPAQQALLATRARTERATTRRWVTELENFWSQTIPDALRLPFPNVQITSWTNLQELYLDQHDENGQSAYSPAGGDPDGR
jgi:hypothetical protein